MGKDSRQLLVSRTAITHFNWRVHGCSTIYQTDRSQIGGTTRWKWNNILSSTLDPPQLDTLSLIRAKNRFGRRISGYSDRNKISWPPPEVTPNIPVIRNRSGPFDPKMISGIFGKMESAPIFSLNKQLENGLFKICYIPDWIKQVDCRVLLR